jgi:uncharacterized protein (DUF1501 family)
MSLAASTLPRIIFAGAETDSRLVLIILRGAVDGLSWVAPYGEGRYRTLRGELALAPPGGSDGLLKLDGLFGLHPALSNTHQLYRNNEALVVHAVASPYRDRSHFDGQDVLESGMEPKRAQRDGWLNRALQPLGGSLDNEVAISLSQNTPLVLRGGNSVTSWSPSRLQGLDQETLRRIEALYVQDEFFATRLGQALDSQQIAGDSGGMDERRRGARGAQFASTLKSAARFLTAPSGPRIAVVESGGWDTHANQGAERGSLANRFRELDGGIKEFVDAMGAAWSDTAVIVATEFGRTVGVNGTGGTDHGTAGAALLLGGAIAGGRVLADWPGLGGNDLYEGRDLYPTTDIRSLFKGVLAEHLALPHAFLDDIVFPHSGAAPAFEGLVHS